MSAVTWRVRLANGLAVVGRVFQKIAKVAPAFTEGAPIGVMRRTDIDMAVARSYAAEPDFYNPEHYNLRYEERIIGPVISYVSGKKLLDLYAGQGREAKIFAEHGFSVTAVERLQPVAECGRARMTDAELDVRFIIEDIETWRPEQSDWDVIYTSLWMLSTVPDKAERKRWLEKIAGFGGSDAVFVVSITPHLDLGVAKLRHGIARVLSRLTFNNRRPEFGDRFHRGLFWRDFSDREIRNEFAGAGLAVLERIPCGGADGPPCIFYLLKRQTGEAEIAA
ncbi:MAG: class I SAM-dependent methyltransferase [Pseudomonadota bacterium]